jgi:asparagine synthase (glutamine-hydrolysing)
MSAQFGTWVFGDQAPLSCYLDGVRSVLAAYGPDGMKSYSAKGIDILYSALSTTRESRRESQPYVIASGAVIAWDGRLDNRADLIRELGYPLSCESTDIELVAACYERWEEDALQKLVGDWALSLWDPRRSCLLLAKDFLGIRPLYYALSPNGVTWSTVLDPRLLLPGKSFEIEEEYLAGWFSLYPAEHLTPYRGIHSVPPACSVCIGERSAQVRRYWDFDSRKQIHYADDADYEAHFRTVFRESVGRRLRSNSTVVAELSGGVDSSSIVCVADQLIAQGRADASGLETVSYFDESEPNWNEHSFFSVVEQYRARQGTHIDVRPDRSVLLDYDREQFPMVPGAGVRPNTAARQFQACLRTHGARVVLSGIGGDEVLGGVPAPVGELADLLVTGEFLGLARQLVAWALVQRKPAKVLVGEVARRFLPSRKTRDRSCKSLAPWLQPGFVERQLPTLSRNETRLSFFGPLPSFQENVSTLDHLRRQFSCSIDAPGPQFEKRYPYLDRDLVEFLYAVPREQILRPHQRRSLMRRALAGIVPDRVLNRKRKAFVERSTRLAVADEWPILAEITEHLLLEKMGIVDAVAFRDALQAARDGTEVALGLLKRTLAVEYWLRQLKNWNEVGETNLVETLAGRAQEVNP